MTPVMRARLQAASDFVLAELGKKTPAGTIINSLIADHSASISLRPSGNILRCSGVTGSCTWSADKGLLDAWRRNAMAKIMVESANG